MFFFCFFWGVTADNFPSFLCRPKTVVISGFLSWGGGASECISEFLLLLLYNNGAVFVKTRLWLGWGHKGTYDARIPNKNRKFSIIFITGKRQNMKILIPRTDFIIFFVAIFLADNETFFLPIPYTIIFIAPAKKNHVFQNKRSLPFPPP